MSNLANVLDGMGKLKEAKKLHRTALEVREKSLGPEHPDSLASMNNLAGVLHDMGKLTEAAELLRTALEVREKILGPEHADTLASMKNLAIVLRGMGKLKEAAELCHEPFCACPGWHGQVRFYPQETCLHQNAPPKIYCRLQLPLHLFVLLHFGGKLTSQFLWTSFSVKDGM